MTFLTAAVLGLVTFIAVHAIAAIIEEREARKKAVGEIVKSGLGGFLYLEVLDASFSFDGVIGDMISPFKAQLGGNSDDMDDGSEGKDEGKDEGVEMKQRYGRPSVDLTSVESSDKVHLGDLLFFAFRLSQNHCSCKRFVYNRTSAKEEHQ